MTTPVSASSQQQLLYEIAITLIPGVGDVLAKNLISYCGGVEAVFKQPKHKLLQIPGIGSKLAEQISNFNLFKRAEKEIRFIEKHNIQPLFYLNDNYPERLKSIHDAPTLLYYLGNTDLNNRKIVGIVGTRKATDYGKAFIDKLTEEIAQTGSLIISGLAYGIDIHAHRTALKHQLPTVGILAHGLDRIYPSQHQTTAKKMVDCGGLLTEFPSETNPDRENFPKRNRIVAGLCDVLIVVETAERGGAMITAEIANSYNKDIMALPGRVNEEYSSGCNLLIKKNKAAIITSARDLFELMNWNEHQQPKQAQQTLFDLNKNDLTLINYIKQKNKAGFDDIVFDLQTDAGTLSLQLLELEFKNIIRTLPGKFYELT